MDQDATWYGGKPRPGDVVFDGVAAAPPKRGTVPHFMACVCCGQTAGWIKMPIGTEVLDVDPAPPRRGTVPLFPAHVYCGQMVAHLSYC